MFDIVDGERDDAINIGLNEVGSIDDRLGEGRMGGAGDGL